MKAIEIRNLAARSIGTSDEWTTVLLGEIAAQISELNENLSVFGSIRATLNKFPVLVLETGKRREL